LDHVIYSRVTGQCCRAIKLFDIGLFSYCILFFVFRYSHKLCTIIVY